ncbi:hypothetical protein [Sorangium sp. So ce1151]|uniref:hypothetical protein n=1 Tax=Sorangium sp. So ce1151 TaxID=3133332 RepID=UPI003F61FFDD
MSTATSNDLVAKSNDVTLRVRFEFEKERLNVHLAVSNGGTSSVFLTDFVLDPKTGTARTDSLWVDFIAPRTAVLWSHLTPLDPNVAWSQPPSAYVTKVSPGETYRSVMSAPIPLRLSAYRRGGPNGEPNTALDPVIDCSQLRFDLGVISDSPELDARRLEIKGKVVHEVLAAAWRHQKIISVEALNVQVKLLTK